RTLDAIEQAIDDVLDVAPHVLDDLRRERLAHEGAKPRVIGRVAEQHRPGKTTSLRVAAIDRGAQLLEPVAPEAPVAEDHDDVVIPGEHPESGRSLVHGRDGTEA